MGSSALAEWQGARSARLNRLAAAHRLVRDPVNRLNPEHLNAAMLLAVASEFQAFARTLHDLACGAFADAAAGDNLRLAEVLRDTLVSGRALERRNATPDALAHDFARLGISLWDALGGAGPLWRTTLATLIQTRNAVAHGNVELNALRDSGLRLNRDRIESWRGNLNALASKMDEVVAAHHAALFATKRPW